MIPLSEQLRNYIDRVQKETERPVLIQEVTDLGLPGMSACIKQHPTSILVEVAPGIPPAELEQTVAHEITHGLLRYKLGYREIDFSHPIEQRDRRRINMLASMVEDLVVSKIMQDEGFPSFAPNYLEEVEKETKAARKKENHYRDFKDPLVKSVFMVYRYILAWGFLRFTTTDLPTRRKLNAFMTAFQTTYLRQYQMARKITDLIEHNDILTPNGCSTVIEKCLELWDLRQYVN